MMIAINRHVTPFTHSLLSLTKVDRQSWCTSRVYIYMRFGNICNDNTQYSANLGSNKSPSTTDPRCILIGIDCNIRGAPLCTKWVGRYELIPRFDDKVINRQSPGLRVWGLYHNTTGCPLAIPSRGTPHLWGLEPIVYTPRISEQDDTDHY